MFHMNGPAQNVWTFIKKCFPYFEHFHTIIYREQVPYSLPSFKLQNKAVGYSPLRQGCLPTSLTAKNVILCMLKADNPSKRISDSPSVP